VTTSQIDRQHLRLWDLLHLGYALCRMQGCKSEDILVSYDGAIPGIVDRLDALEADLEKFGLQDSRDVFRLKVRRLIFRLEHCGEQILGDNVSDLQDSLDELIDAVREEACGKYSYLVEPSKKLDIARLLTEPSQYFGIPDLLDPPLPVEVDNNLREAGRCLAVDFGPAAVLFTLLATETVTKYYYRIVAKDLPLSKSKRKPRTWGQVVKALKEEPAYKCPPQITGSLEDIVKGYRNPAMHASIELNGGMALDLWGMCSEVTQMMIRDLSSRGKIVVVEFS
jgi:hypothetical protein